jgi:hypothetical protein
MRSVKFASAALLAFGVLSVSAASAGEKMLDAPAGKTLQLSLPTSWPAPTPCFKVAADAALLIKGEPVHQYGSAKSQGVGYARRDCGYFVLEITLPAGFEVYSGVAVLRGGVDKKLAEAECAKTGIRVHFFRKQRQQNAGPAYIPLKSTGADHGSWLFEFGGAGEFDCDVGAVPLHVKSPVSPAAVFRILIAAQQNGKPLPVFGSWARYY